MWHCSGTYRSALIPVLVTGIQPRRVCAVIDFYPFKKSSAPKDLGSLDSCDAPRVKPEHRNEGASSRHRNHSITS
ncbi:hypothetical protein B5K08_30435 [Rhizobium leguminosarum bv. trifolii]|uniref:Uncharacterized protein n=1 Tax=Rhizobium leguminosarum bv. trifolii TaxID=386 RepID=A0A3E1AYG8_RHILT|nr:hypothetical protein B5K10_30430 [Rhizobium leguminosarum bv. trifolii]RFB82539.1 hypothetical protein B5K08_30435 [Rhizobium leguminosarum bv. trifolii]